MSDRGLGPNYQLLRFYGDQATLAEAARALIIGCNSGLKQCLNLNRTGLFDIFRFGGGGRMKSLLLLYLLFNCTETLQKDSPFVLFSNERVRLKNRRFPCFDNVINIMLAF